MDSQLSKKEFAELKSLFSAYEIYNRGLARLFRIGFYIALFVTGILWLIGTVATKEFHLAALILIALVVFICCMFFTLLIWANIKANARKFVKKTQELQITEEKIKQMIRADLAKASKEDIPSDVSNNETDIDKEENFTINQKLWKIIQISSAVIALGGCLIAYFILPKERLPDGGLKTIFPSTTFQVVALMIYLPLVFLFFFATSVRKIGNISLQTVKSTILYMASLGVFFFIITSII